MPATMLRTWTRTEAADKSLVWLSDDGRAEVRVFRVADGWRVEMYEDGQYIGSEPASLYRGGAAGVARRWVKAMSKPMED